MRLPADQIRHSRRDRLLDDEVVDETRRRAADEDQYSHRQELAAVSLKHLVGAGRTQEIDERADVTQDRDFDQRHDQADRHQRRKIGPDLQAIAPVVADEARWRHAVVVIAKRIDAGLEETEHGLISTGNRGRSRIRKRRPTRRRKRRGAGETGKRIELGLSRGPLAVGSPGEPGRHGPMEHRMTGSAAVGVQIASNRNHSGSLKLAPRTISRA